ncbi:uncharacterized protein V1516DRAFT_693960 [Lipomyces oligophaga]|uniref:uncharacterized protein n=1 Tax=Lipomyces oligophaga TaxID=45792 RepID=UPI0034CEF230
MRRHTSRSRHSYTPGSSSLSTSLSSNSSNSSGSSTQIEPSENSSSHPFKLHAPVRPSPLGTHNQNGMPLEIWDRLRSFRLFADAPDGFLMAISKKLRPQFYSKQEYILNEGEDARAMYWIVRGAVAVTSRDGESVYAELTAGAFFGEIGILFHRPRTASIIARSKCMVVVLTAEALNKVLPQFPGIELAIREEAQERLNLLEKQKEQENGNQSAAAPTIIQESASKQSETPNTNLAIRELLKEMPLFATLPSNILHTLALSVEPRRYAPFELIIRQYCPGRELFFVSSGTVEVLDEKNNQVKARLSKGSHFGEVTFLSLAPSRTASVRSVTMVECLTLTGQALNDVLKDYPDIMKEIEQTARQRLASNRDEPTDSATGTDISKDMTCSMSQETAGSGSASEPSTIEVQTENEQTEVEKPLDPDPFSQSASSYDEEAAVEESEIAASIPLADNAIQILSITSSSETTSASSSRSSSESLSTAEADDEQENSSDTYRRRTRPSNGESSPHTSKRARKESRLAQAQARHRLPDPDISAELGKCPDTVMVEIFKSLDLRELIRVRRVCKRWNDLVHRSPQLFRRLDLSPYNTEMYDNTVSIISRIAGSRPQYVDLSNCFHITDAGFAQLVRNVGKDIRIFRMKSVWEVSGLAIMELIVPSIARTLEEIDFSNCRKVGDATLARVVGWVIPETGSVVGCPRLKRIGLSYCKHITDKSMHHLAMHACDRLQVLDLTRCTTVTDIGFSYWGQRSFPVLTRLCLADCTFLTDKAIIALASSAKALEELDLSFCCALSDVSVEVLSLGCQHLKNLNLGFCGSAVSDASLRAVALHLIELRTLSVRGCVRVTNEGVAAIGDGCVHLETFDVSQCRNVDCKADPLDSMIEVQARQSEHSLLDHHPMESANSSMELRAGGSGKVKTYGTGVALWRGRVRVLY